MSQRIWDWRLALGLIATLACSSRTTGHGPAREGGAGDIGAGAAVVVEDPDNIGFDITMPQAPGYPTSKWLVYRNVP